MPSTTTDRTASCSARSLPLSSMAASTPPPDQARTTAPAPPGVGRGHGLGGAHRRRRRRAARGWRRPRPPRRPRGGQRVASRPITPWPNTATRSPSRTSAASTALRAIEPTRAKVPEIASSAVHTRGPRRRPGAPPRCGGPRCRAPRRRPRRPRRRRRPRRPHPPRSSPSPRRGSEGRLALDEEPAVGVPGAREVGVGAAVGRQLGARGDAGVPRAHPDRTPASAAAARTRRAPPRAAR